MAGCPWSEVAICPSPRTGRCWGRSGSSACGAVLSAHLPPRPTGLWECFYPRSSWRWCGACLQGGSIRHLPGSRRLLQLPRRYTDPKGDLWKLYILVILFCTQRNVNKCSYFFMIPCNLIDTKLFLPINEWPFIAYLILVFIFQVGGSVGRMKEVVENRKVVSKL